MRHRKTRDRIHDQHNVHALVAKKLGNCGCRVSRARTHQRRLIGGRHHHYRARQSLASEIFVDKVKHFATTFANQGDHINIGSHVAGNHAQQRAFPDAATGEDADPLAAPHGEQGIDRPYAGFKNLLNPGAGKRIKRLCLQLIMRLQWRQRFTVKRLTERIDDPAQQFLADLNLDRTAGGNHFAAEPNAAQLAIGHQTVLFHL